MNYDLPKGHLIELEVHPPEQETDERPLVHQNLLHKDQLLHCLK